MRNNTNRSLLAVLAVLIFFGTFLIAASWQSQGQGGQSTGGPSGLPSGLSFSGGTLTGTNLTATGALSGATYLSATNCSNSGGTCGSAAAGSVTIAAAATTVTIATTAVTANSNIMLTENAAISTRLGVTCNTTAGRTYAVTTVTAGTSFVVTTSAAPVTNPACLSYWIID